jgi:hypothetical protein
MSPRVVIRSLVHRIISHPDISTSFSAKCGSCSWATSKVSARSEEAVDVECMTHAGRSNHRQFTRLHSSLAFVVREGEDLVPPPVEDKAP